MEHHLEIYEARFKAFGFYTQVIDGHDINAIATALKNANEHQEGPSFIVCKTFKGKGGQDGIEDSKDWHGKPLGAKSAHTIDYLKTLIKNPDVKLVPRAPHKEEIKEEEHHHVVGDLHYKKGDKISTRLAFGNTLKKLGDVDK